jgi:hypothetical protein
MKEKRKNLWLKGALIGLCAVVIMFGLSTGSVLAEQKLSPEEQKECDECEKKTAQKHLPPHLRPGPADASGHKHGSLAAAATNPIAPMVQFQLEDTYNWENYNSSGYSNVTVVQAVAPIPLPWKSVPMLITRSTLPWVTTPDFDGPVDRKRGFGDFEMLLLATPKLKTKGVQVGLGLNTSWPTAGDNDFTGSGKYEAGPAGLYINMRTPHLQWGLFAHQLWDYANSNDNQDRSSVSKLSIQPILTYHFGKGWYVSSPESPQAYNFHTDEWSWNIGPVLGRVFKIGKLPVKLFGAVYYNPTEPDDSPAAEWTAKFGLTFLFPE